MFSLQVVNGYYVEFLIVQLRSQTYVLIVTVNRLRQVIGFNGDIYGVFIFIYYDRSNVCRCYCVNYELRRVIILQDDIDTFVIQFSRYRLNTRVTYIYVSIYRIDTFIVGFYRDFRTRIRIASRCFNFNYFFVDFWYFNTEQFDQYFRFGTSDEQLRVTRFRANGIEYVTNAVVRAEVFTRQYIFAQDYGFSVVVQIQRDVVAVYFFYYVGDDFIFVFTELINYYRTFGFTYFLYDNLFCRLGSDTVKGNRFNLIFNVIVQVQVFIFITCGFKGDFFGRLGDFINN